MFAIGLLIVVLLVLGLALACVCKSVQKQKRKKHNYELWHASGVEKSLKQIPSQADGMRRDITRVEVNWSRIGTSQTRDLLERRELQFVEHINARRMALAVPKHINRMFGELGVLSEEKREEPLPKGSHRKLVEFLVAEEKNWTKTLPPERQIPVGRYGTSLSFQAIEATQYEPIVAGAKRAKAHLNQFEEIHLPNIDEICQEEDTTEVYARYLSEVEDALAASEGVLRNAIDAEIALVKRAGEMYWRGFLERHVELFSRVTPPDLARVQILHVYDTEAQFEELYVMPWIEYLGWRSIPQHTVELRIGSSIKSLYVDQVIVDEGGKFALIECKRKIKSKSQLKDATEQAKSYALLLGFTVFLVMAPEGLWIYSLDRNKEKLVYKNDSLKDILQRSTQVRSVVSRYRAG